MKIAIFAYSRGGCATARRVCAALPEAETLCYTMPRFEEEETMTQEQFNTLMEGYWRSLAQREPADWSAEAREWAEKNGLIVGDGNGNKQYRSFVTREQLAVFLKRLRELEK